jgi:aminocarboxymuconate-semialdehyde decarboxylase
LIPINPEKLAPLGVNWDADRQSLDLDGHPLGLKLLYQPQSLIAWMDKNNVETAWIFVPPPAYRQELSEERTRLWCDYVNDGLLGIASAFSSRMASLVHLPVERLAPALTSQSEVRPQHFVAFASTVSLIAEQHLS